MQESARLHRGINVGVWLALVLAPAAVVSGCGDDDDDGTVDTDGGSGAGGDEGGSGGSGGEAGEGGEGGEGGESGEGGEGGDGGGGAGGSEDDGGMDPAAEAFRSVTVDMTDMTPHVDQLMQFRIVSADDELVALGVLDPILEADVAFAMPNSTPEGDHRMDFFADLNGNRTYQMPPADHAWRLDIPAGDDVTIDFMHNTDFEDIDDPTVTEAEDFTFNAEDMDPHVGQMFELRVIELPSERLVGRYVLGEITDAAFTIELAGIIQPDTAYQIDFTADLNDDGAYDAPPTDHAWRETAESDSNGLTVDFTHGTSFTDVEF